MPRSQEGSWTSDHSDQSCRDPSGAAPGKSGDKDGEDSLIALDNWCACEWVDRWPVLDNASSQMKNNCYARCFFICKLKKGIQLHLQRILSHLYIQLIDISLSRPAPRGCSASFMHSLSANNCFLLMWHTSTHYLHICIYNHHQLSTHLIYILCNLHQHKVLLLNHPYPYREIELHWRQQNGAAVWEVDNK